MRLSASSVSAKEHSPTVIRSSTPPTISDSFTSRDFTPVNVLSPIYKFDDLLAQDVLIKRNLKEWIMMNMFISVDRCIDMKD